MFNRRTPIADMFRELDGKELQNLEGKATVVLISDGAESFYDLDADEKQKPEKKACVEGPLGEIRRIKQKYGGEFVLHTVFMDKRKTRGRTLLEKMAEAGGGKSFNGIELAEDRSGVAEFCAIVGGR